MKTGIHIQPINEPILQEVMDKFNYTSKSSAINYIMQEYKRLSDVENDIISVYKEDDKDKKPVEHDFSSWFVAEEKK